MSCHQCLGYQLRNCHNIDVSSIGSVGVDLYPQIVECQEWNARTKRENQKRELTLEIPTSYNFIPSISPIMNSICLCPNLLSSPEIQQMRVLFRLPLI